MTFKGNQLRIKPALDKFEQDKQLHALGSSFLEKFNF